MQVLTETKTHWRDARALVQVAVPSGSTDLASMSASEVAKSTLAGVTARMRQVSFEMNVIIMSRICASMSRGWSPTGILVRPGKSISVMFSTAIHPRRRNQDGMETNSKNTRDSGIVNTQRPPPLLHLNPPALCHHHNRNVNQESAIKLRAFTTCRNGSLKGKTNYVYPSTAPVRWSSLTLLSFPFVID